MMASCKPAAARRAKRTRLGHRWLRYGIQVAFFILAPAVFSGAFSAVKACFAEIGAGEPLEMTAFAALLVGVLAFTVLFGRFFCGYACAFGTLGDVLHDAFDFLRSKTPIPALRFPRPLVRVLSLVKYAVLAAICLACFTGAWQLYSGYSPWVAFAAILAGSLDGVDAVAFVLLGLVAVGMVLRERFFCQFLCPLGAIFSLMPVLGVSEFTRTRAHCAPRCGKCRETCPVDIWPDADTLLHGECIACGRCADVCPMANVNLVAIERPAARRERLAAEGRPAGKGAPAAEAGRQAAEGPGAAAADAAPGRAAASGKRGAKAVAAAGRGPAEPRARPLRKTRGKWLLFRGTKWAYTLAKAAALLALFWALGATRYLPAFAQVVGPLPWIG